MLTVEVNQRARGPRSASCRLPTGCRCALTTCISLNAYGIVTRDAVITSLLPYLPSRCWQEKERDVQRARIFFSI